MTDPAPQYPVLRSHAEVSAVLKDVRFSIFKPVSGGDAALDHGPDDRRRSRRVAPLSQVLAQQLAPRSIAALEPALDGWVQDSMDRGRAAGGMDLAADLAYLLPARVMMALLGLPQRDFTALAPHFDAIALGHGYCCTRIERARAQLSIRAVEGWVSDCRAEAARTPLLAEIDAVAKGAGIAPETVDYWMAMLLFAGSTTTRDFLSNVLAVLIERPTLAAELGRDPALLSGSGMEELLRAEGPVRRLARVAREAVALGPWRFAPGDVVVLDIEGANRDPGVFSDPTRLDLRRSPNWHLSFGAGVTHCLGAQLARMEARIVLRHVLPLLGRILPAAPFSRLESEVLHGRSRISVAFL